MCSTNTLCACKFECIGSGQEFSKISAGWGHSAALTKQGDVFIFGRPYEFSTLMRINAVYTFAPFLARKISRSTNSDVFSTYINYFLKYLKNIPALKIQDADLMGKYPTTASFSLVVVLLLIANFVPSRSVGILSVAPEARADGENLLSGVFGWVDADAIRRR